MLVSSTPAAPTPPVERSRWRTGGRHGVLLAVPAVGLLGAVFLVPVAGLVWTSFADPALGLANYRELFTDGVSVVVVLRTLRMATIVTLVTLVLAYPYAYLMTVVGPRARSVMVALVLLPFWTSLLARTFAWIVLLQDNGPVNDLLTAVGLGPLELAGTEAGVTIGMTQVLLPFMTLPLYGTLRTIDRRLIDAALVLGARPLTAFRRVYLPLSMPGVVAGAVMVYILALGFYVTPAMLGSPGESMVSQLMTVRITQLLDFGGGGALATVLFLLTLLLLAVVSRFGSVGAALGMAPRGDR
ncbi:ABC transporter permease [Nonomuraea helvata]|uniref:ABC transporter permease n=1 Tax=Nonomuraea helvata TaxID=37484 RepID=A0ABV5S729_9ACTN